MEVDGGAASLSPEQALRAVTGGGTLCIVPARGDGGGGGGGAASAAAAAAATPLAALPPVLGIDTHSWRVGSKCMGIKMIPPGVHLLYYAGSDNTPPAATFITFRAGSVVVAEWDAHTELLRLSTRDEVDAAVAAQWETAVRSMTLDAQLGAYPLQDASHWQALASHITPAVVDRLQPVGGTIVSDVCMTLPKHASAARTATAAHAGAGVETTDAALTTGGEAKEVDASAAARSPALAPDESGGDSALAAVQSKRRAAGITGTIFWSPLPGAHVASASTAARREYALDSSAALQGSVRHVMRWLRENAHDTADVSAAAVTSHVVGELQVAFTLLVFGQSYSALEQWKHMCDACLRCEDAILAASGVNTSLLRGPAHATVEDGTPPPHETVIPKALLLAAWCAIGTQFTVLPEDFFVDSISKTNFLGTSLSYLARVVARYSSCMDVDLRTAAEALFYTAAERFQWEAPIASALTPAVVSDALCHVVDEAASAGLPDTSAAGTDDASEPDASVLPAVARNFQSVEELLAALQAEGGDDDLPMIV